MFIQERRERFAPVRISRSEQVGQSHSLMFRWLNAGMAALFAFAVAVQFNDPDPARWVAIYGAACLVAVIVAVRGTVPIWLPAAVALVALVWGVVLGFDIPGADAFAGMFDAWEMKSATIEEARETTGLFIVAAWMTVVVAVSWRRQRQSPRSSFGR